MAPQPIQFSGEICRHPIRILFRGSVSFRFTHDAVAIDIEAIVIPVQNSITVVQWVKGSTIVTLGDGIESTHTLAHVRFKTVGHAVAIRIGHTWVKVDAIVVFIELAREPTWEAWCCAVRRVGPTEFFSGVQAVPVDVQGCI